MASNRTRVVLTDAQIEALLGAVVALESVVDADVEGAGPQQRKDLRIAQRALHDMRRAQRARDDRRELRALEREARTVTERRARD